MKIPELSQPDIPESAAFRICNNLAVAIESAIYLQNNESIVINNYNPSIFRIKITKKSFKCFFLTSQITETTNFA